jgi:hypothetical protein
VGGGWHWENAVFFFSSDLHLSDISTKAMARNEGQGQAFVFGGEGHR